MLDRLDQAYACWEEGMWRARVRRQFSDLAEPNRKAKIVETGFPVDGAQRTKQLLLEAVSRGNADYLLPSFREKGYTSRPDLDPEEADRLEKIPDVLERYEVYPDAMIVGAAWEEFHFPYYLGKWSTSSRRIYYLPDDLTLQLQATSLKGLTLRDIKLPFSSFCIALESPLVNEKGKELDFFLIANPFSESHALFGFARSLSKWKHIDPVLRSKIDESVRKGNLRRFTQLIPRNFGWMESVSSHWDAFAETGDPVPDEALDENLEYALRNQSAEDWMVRFARVLFGLCVYLQTFTKTYPGLVEPVPPMKKIYAGCGDGPALMSAADVCKVQSVVKLTLEEKDIIRDQLSGRGGWEVRAHFREGFWRRPPGEGQNPLAEKTIWVRPTLVRRDRLPENTLPLGVGKIVTT